MWKLVNFDNRSFFPRVFCHSPSPHTLKQTVFTIPKLVNNNKWLLILTSAGICVLISLGYYLRCKLRKNPKQLQIHPNQLSRSGVWKSLQFGSFSTPITPIVEFSQLTTDQLFENGTVSFQQAVNSWRACCEVITAHETELGLEDESDVDSSIHGANSPRISERRMRALLLQADYLSQCIERVRSGSSVNGSIGDYSFKLDESGSDFEFRETWNQNHVKPTVPFPYASSDASDDNDRTLEILSQSTDSFESAVRSDILLTPISKQTTIPPTITIQHNNLYKQAIELATNKQIFVRRFRTEMLHCNGDIDFAAKLHCVRLAFDLLVESEENRSFFELQTREMITRFLTKANKDTNTFSMELTAMIEFVQSADNIPNIRKELNDRNLKVIGFWDVAIDFALLDAFSDLENLPTPVTMVTQNSWLTPSLRESALTNAIWAVMQGKVKMLEDKNGFMSHFYKLGDTFMFSLAWGFLGTDEQLKETCLALKNGVLLYLREIFDLGMADYSSVGSLSEDVIRIGRDKLTLLNSNL